MYWCIISGFNLVTHINVSNDTQLRSFVYSAIHRHYIYWMFAAHMYINTIYCFSACTSASVQLHTCKCTRVACKHRTCAIACNMYTKCTHATYENNAFIHVIYAPANFLSQTQVRSSADLAWVFMLIICYHAKLSLLIFK